MKRGGQSHDLLGLVLHACGWYLRPLVTPLPNMTHYKDESYIDSYVTIADAPNLLDLVTPRY